MDSVENLQATEQPDAKLNEKYKKKKGFRLEKLRYKNMNVRARLFTGFSTILFFVLVLGVTNYMALGNIEDNMNVLNDRELALMKNYDNVNYAQANKIAAARGYILTQDETYIEELDQFTDYQHREIERVLHHEGTDVVGELFAELFALDEYLETEVIGYIDNGFQGEAMANMSQVFEPRADALMTELQERAENQSLDARQYIFDVQDQIDTTQIFMGIVMVVAVVISILASWWFANTFNVWDEEAKSEIIELDATIPVCKISFELEVENVLKSKIMQVFSMDAVRDIVQIMLNDEATVVETKEEPIKQVSTEQTKQEQIPKPEEVHTEIVHEKVNVKKPVLQELEENTTQNKPRNLDLIMDVPLEFSVMLGDSQKSIRDILSLGTGSVVELDKMTEEPLDIFVNGKKIAQGEVVVINENFGIRITSILSKENRIQEL